MRRSVFEGYALLGEGGRGHARPGSGWALGGRARVLTSCGCEKKSSDDDEAESDDRERIAGLEAIEHGEVDWDDDGAYSLGRGQSWSGITGIAPALGKENDAPGQGGPMAAVGAPFS